MKKKVNPKPAQGRKQKTPWEVNKAEDRQNISEAKGWFFEKDGWNWKPLLIGKKKKKTQITKIRNKIMDISIILQK